MIRVRFPNGTTIQYNTATSMRYKPEAWELYADGEKGKQIWVASIQLTAGAVVEGVPACWVYDAKGDAVGIRFEGIRSDISAIRRKIGKLSTAERKARRGR